MGIAKLVTLLETPSWTKADCAGVPPAQTYRFCETDSAIPAKIIKRIKPQLFLAADSSAQAVRPCPPMTHWRKHHARLSAVQRCASASPSACRLPGSLSRLSTQVAAGWCPPAASLDHRPFPAGTDRPACDSADRRRLNRRRESPHASRILWPGIGTMPAARRSAGPSIPDRRGIPSVATRRHCFGFDS